MYDYIAKTGVRVISTEEFPPEDFKTVVHYLAWSWKSWGTKIIKAYTHPEK